MENEFIKHYS